MNIELKKIIFALLDPKLFIKFIQICLLINCYMTNLYNPDHIFKLKKHQDFLELYSSNKKSYAKIFLNRGASLEELTLNGHKLIKDMSPMPYSDTYASAILFPFANRIKDGRYEFDGKIYQLAINQKQENNAIHGLVYNKTFKIISAETTEKHTSVTLAYNAVNESKGFPFTYQIQLVYTLTTEHLNLNISVKNTSSKSFPFTLGWHPYFNSENLYNSSLKFESNKKFVLGKRMITTGVEDFKKEKLFAIKDKKLDDCFILNSNEILFLTPAYTIQISASSQENFLQIYTPTKVNTIAIEPTTGVSDSFNNKIGLQVLEPDNFYNTDWNIKLLKNNYPC